MSINDNYIFQVKIDGKWTSIKKSTSLEVSKPSNTNTNKPKTISLSFDCPPETMDFLNYIIDKQERQKAIQAYSIQKFREAVKSQVLSLYYNHNKERP